LDAPMIWSGTSLIDDTINDTDAARIDLDPVDAIWDAAVRRVVDVERQGGGSWSADQ
jgi:hypothetical protein